MKTMTQSLKAAASVLVALMFMLAPTFPVTAQHHQQQGAMQQSDSTRGMMPGGMMGMMQGGMMQMHMQMMEQMMQDPLRRSALLVQVLPTLNEPLDLSDDQVARLEQGAQQFAEQKQTHQNQMTEAGQQLQELLASENAAPDQVRELLQEVATHHAQMQALAYETASDMKAVLTDTQRQQLAEMPPMQLHHFMMTNMTMMEMMQVMHGGMMQGGMMQGGMMQGGMMDKMNR